MAPVKGKRGEGCYLPVVGKMVGEGAHGQEVTTLNRHAEQLPE
jgi:hypothetical protein